MLARDTIVTPLWGGHPPCLLREVGDVLHSGCWEGGHHVGVPEGHSPHSGSHHVHVDNPSGPVLDYVGSINHCHCWSHQHIWLPHLWGVSMGAGKGESLSKQAAITLSCCP